MWTGRGNGKQGHFCLMAPFWDNTHPQHRETLTITVCQPKTGSCCCFEYHTVALKLFKPLKKRISRSRSTGNIHWTGGLTEIRIPLWMSAWWFMLAASFRLVHHTAAFTVSRSGWSNVAENVFLSFPVGRFSALSASSFQRYVCSDRPVRRGTSSTASGAFFLSPLCFSFIHFKLFISAPGTVPPEDALMEGGAAGQRVHRNPLFGLCK